MNLTEVEYQAIIEKQVKAPAKKAKTPRGPNKTELRFERDILESGRRDGTFIAWHYELVTIRLPQGFRYTPDFYVLTPDYQGKFGQAVLIEVKGPYIHNPASRLRFLTARQACPWWDFQAWQYKEGEWWEIWR